MAFLHLVSKRNEFKVRYKERLTGQEIHAWVLISGRRTVVFLRTGGKAMGCHLLPPPAKTTRPLRVPFPLPSLPFPHAHLSSPSPYVGHDSAGCGGFSCQHLTAKKENKKRHRAWIGGRATKNCFSKDQKNSESARDITPRRTHTPRLNVPTPWRSSIYQEKLRRNP